MTKRTRTVVGVFGALLMIFGLACINYTKIVNAGLNTLHAKERGLPPPSLWMAHLGMLLAPLGGGLVGFAVGRGSQQSAR